MEVQTNCCETFRNEDPDQSEVIPPYLNSSVESIAKKEGFISHSVISKTFSTNGGNYLAELYIFDIKGETNEGEKELNLFVKNTIPTGDMTFISASEVFARESFVYKNLAKIIKKLEDEVDIPVQERYKMVRGFDESSLEFIIMENITKKGFKTCGRKEIPSLRFMELAIQQLAKFHGLGFAIKKMRPRYFEEILMKMNFPLELNDQWSSFFEKVIEKSVTGIRDDLKKKVEKFGLVASKKYHKYYSDSSTKKSLCHGDFRVLNLMMKEEEGEVKEVIPVDLQLVHYGCPVNDILYFIAGCTDRKFRRSHFDFLIDLYYESLKKYLQHFDIDVSDVYPRSEFDATIKEKADFILIVAIAFFPFTLANEDDYPEVGNISSINCGLDPCVVNRIEEMIEEIDDLGLL